MSHEYDIIVVGGGPVGLATAYEGAKAGKKVLLLEQFHFFNQSGSSGDLVRMFRTMYTEDYLADLALQAHKAWQDLESDSAEHLIWMTGLLNFGDPNAPIGPEGTLLGPIPNLDRHKMSYRKLTREEIYAEFPFKNLPESYEGILGELNGCINVPLTLRTLHRLLLQYGARAVQHAQVTKVTHIKSGGATVSYLNTEDGTTHNVTARKVAITGGAYVNHVLRPSFGFELELDIWEMVYSYFSVNPGPNGTLLKSMWFQFAEAAEEGQIPNLFYGFPALPWGVPNTIRIAIDAAVRRIKDPEDRTVSPAHEILQHSADWVKTHIKGVNPIPNFTGNCLQTNVPDNNFVIDFIPNTNNDIAIFTAGWAMKFVPLLGKILTELLTEGKTQYDISNFKITREGVIKKPPVYHAPQEAGRSIFIGGKFAPTIVSQCAKPSDVVPATAHPLCGSSTPVKATTLLKADPTKVGSKLLRKLAVKHQKAQSPRAALVNSLLHACATPPPTDIVPITAASVGVSPPVALEALLGTKGKLPISVAASITKPLSAHKIIKRQYKETLVDSPALGAKHIAPPSQAALDLAPHLTVGIIGGGVAGLYAAMILKDLGIDFTVFEANEDRWGGRVYTHHFKELQPQYKGIYDYVDLGAMRFPKIKTMQRTFDLFDKVGLDEKHHRERYILSDDNNILYYNGVRLTRAQYTEAVKKNPDPLHFAESNGGGVPDSYVIKGANAILDEAFGPILDKLNTDFNSGFVQLMQTDGLSTRAYLMNLLTKQRAKPDDAVNVVNWLETLNTASGLYDEAFSESIMDALDFQDTDTEGKEIEWWCIKGGTEQLVNRMVNKELAGTKLLKGQEITKISPAADGHGITLSIRNVAAPKEAPVQHSFSHVISTVPLSILRQIDMEDCNPGYHKRTAMRIMHYDHSTKVAIVFKTRWWQKLAKPIFGGQSSTDLFIRTVVYPSQGIADEDAPGILLVSYSWAQDASRMASICLREDVAERCLENLATIHDIPLKTLKDQYTGLIKYVDWHREPFLDGAFALFGPGQFVAFFKGAITPEVHGHLHFAGEALSVHHAWIIGSLNSAYRTVHEILVKESLQDKINLLKKNWGTIDQVEYGGVNLDKYVKTSK